MQSRATLFGHPLHQVLVVLPLGLLAASVVFDLVHLLGDSESAAIVARPLIAAGLVGGVVAAPWGYLDWRAMARGSRAKSIGAWHGAGNVLVLLLFAGSWWLRQDETAPPPMLAHLLSFGAAAVALVAAWLGGELVDRLKTVPPRAPADTGSPPTEPPPMPPHPRAR
ncbi:DUF2231 domain-containing protein [Ideonella sp.]|uniref:DUF2231 domain-containing protein n=1 Tax=Ideonella sp. TaxID=1929293 RepID=UPI0035B2128E